MKQKIKLLIIIPIFLNITRAAMAEQRITANFFYEKADSIAKTFVTNPTLLQIRSENVDTLGKATGWDYRFVDYGAFPLMFQYAYVDIHLGLDSVFTDTMIAVITGIISVDSGWIDSDSVMAIAEANGGRQFREKYGDVIISNNLCRGSADPYTTWVISYNSSNHKLSFFLNALTGSILYQGETDVQRNETQYHYNFLRIHPNPFNSSTTVTFSIKKAGRATLKIFDIRGQRVDILFDSFFNRGRHNIQWSPESLPSGPYFCRLETDRTVLTQKIIYSK